MEMLISLTALFLLPSITEALPTSSPSQNRTIEWHPCPEVEAELRAANPNFEFPLPFDCATLPVPFDYTDAGRGMLNLALVRVNATKEPVLGTVLYNPGGPGGAGVENLPVLAEDLITVLGGQYNVVSWDPRGTGKTIPFDCKIGKSPYVGRRDVASSPSFIRANLTERFLNGGWDDAQLYSDACYSAMNETGDVLGTAFVARDMIEIVDALGEDGMLRYWGTSYGTQLGSTVVSMFPERVERVLLDAVSNPHDFVAGHFGNYLVDADKTLLAFLEECVQAKDRCSLAKYTGLTTSVDLLELLNTRLEPLLQKRNNKQGILGQWPSLADILTSTLNGSASELSVSTDADVPVPYNLGVDSVNGIRCSDALWRATQPEDILEQVNYQATVSKSFSDVGYEGTWTCAAWKMKAKEQYTGNFTVKTNFPVMLVNSMFDVATPILSAFNVSAGFAGSVVLKNSGYGHGLTAHPSLCVAAAVQKYFKEGVLPEEDTVCDPDVGAWDLQTSDLRKRGDL